MSFEAFEHYLSDDSRRGPAPDGAFSGAAGGAPCGDLVRVSLAVERGRVLASRFDAEGCAATMAAGAAVAEAAEDAGVLDAADEPDWSIRVGPPAGTGSTVPTTSRASAASSNCSPKA